MKKTLRTVYPSTHCREDEPGRLQQDAASGFKCTCCPVGRSGHRIVVTEDSLYSLGGFNPVLGLGGNHNNIPLEQDERGFPLLQELWKFNLSSRQWQVLDDFTSVPATIASHTVAKVGRWLFLFGGTSIPFGETPTSAVYRYDLLGSHHPPADGHLDTREDEVALRRSGDRWQLVSVTGEIPDERYGHTMTMQYPDVYIVGGTSGYIYNAEVFHLDLRQPTGKWTKLSSDVDPKQPVGRYRHETAFRDGVLYVFGGGTDRDAFSLVHVHTFDVDARQWGTLKSLPDPQHDVYLVGGLSGISHTEQLKMFDDIWRFSIHDASWTKFSITLTMPLYFHSADICERSGCIWIFGGVTSGARLGMLSTRTNQLMCLRVKVGKLLELAWAIVCDCLCSDWSKADLDELGIPSFLQARLQS